MKSLDERFQDEHLLYAATARCRCGAGLAYPIDTQAALELRAWCCSAVLKGDVPPDQSGDHDALPFTFYKVREETSINNIGGYSTRPSGTRAMTVGHAKCPKCGHTWESAPYSACGASHHWRSGPCPNCGYAVGGGGVWKSGEEEPIAVSYADVVINAREAA